MNRSYAAALSALAVLLLALAGCGGEDETTPTESAAATTSSTSTESTQADTNSDAADAAADAGAEESAVYETVSGWLLEGGCDRMTDEFLEEQTFISDPAQACETFEAGFAPPAYTADDIVFTDLMVDGDKARVVVGSEGVDISSLYRLVLEDGVWKIDSAELI